MRPRIGIRLNQNTPDLPPDNNYVKSVLAAGGEVVVLPNMAASEVASALNGLQGLVLTGGDYAFPEQWYAGATKSPYAQSPRLEADLACVFHTISERLPVLGVCAGMQLIACHVGGRMTGNVHTHVPNAIRHRGQEADIPHEVLITPGTLLAGATDEQAYSAASSHNEAVVSLPENVIISARAPDGVIEAIELPGHPFALGVQWHPERGTHAADARIYAALVKAAIS